MKRAYVFCRLVAEELCSEWLRFTPDGGASSTRANHEAHEESFESMIAAEAWLAENAPEGRWIPALRRKPEDEEEIARHSTPPPPPKESWLTHWEKEHDQ